MGIKNVVGQAVSGEDFFERPKEIKKLWKAIKSGSHILISAPRRVGKTSIMYYIMDNPEKNYCCVYVITQSINSANGFYKKIFNALVDASSICNTTVRYSEGAKKLLSTVLDRIKSIGVETIGSLELNEGKGVDYKLKLANLLTHINLGDSKLIIMVDEFTQTVENIRKKDGEKEAVNFLQANREITQDREIRKNIQFIFTGSIGLENIVSQLNSVDLINDLYSHKVMPLTMKESCTFIDNLLKNLEFSMQAEVIDYMLQKIEWFIPFYIQLFISEISNLQIDREFSEVSKKIIDDAFKKMLSHRNHFEHWHKRLKKSFKKEEYLYAVDVLNNMAKKGTLSSNEIFDLAVKNGFEEGYREVLQILAYDGYINNNDDPLIYRFNSLILKSWWYKNVTN